MSKAKVSIINQFTLKLDEDAKKDDIIDLREITSIDTTIITDKISKMQDEVYLKQLKQVKEEEALKAERDLTIAASKFQETIIKLEEQLKQIKSETESNLRLEHEKHVSSLKLDIQKLENSIILNNKNKELEYNEKVKSLLTDKSKLESEFLLFKKDNELKTLEKTSKLKEEYEQRLNEKQKEIDKITLERSLMNVKEIGENLEKWCDNEFNSQNLVMPENIVWEKANEVIKNTKPDFIYKVYANSEKRETELLTSAAFEMKSEDRNSVNKQTNQKHFKKLHEDRLNRNLEYAILVSTLEWDNVNDVPIKRVNEYEKMYIVRPQYFMTLINIITSFGLKYKDLLLQKEQEKLEFKDTKDIFDEFEAMKESILDNSIRHIQKQLDEIKKQTDLISSANNKIIESADLIINTHLQTVINKINDFKINRVINKINKHNN